MKNMERFSGYVYVGLSSVPAGCSNLAVNASQDPTESLVHGELQSRTLATEKEIQAYELVDIPQYEIQHETFNPQIDTSSPALTLENHHTTARNLREIEPHNESPRRAEGVKGPHLNESTPSKPKISRLSGWAKEVAALNGNTTESGPLEILKDSRVHLTRRTLKAVTELAANRERLPQKSLNVTLLMGGNATPLPDENGNGDEGSQYEGSSQSKISDGIEVSSTPNRDLSYSPYENRVLCSHKIHIRGPLPIIPKHPYATDTLPKGVPGAEVLVQDPLRWEEWHEQKSRLLNLINAQGYSHKAAAWSLSQQAAFHPLIDLPVGYNITKDAGIDVFSPTKEVFEDFSNFLAVVEEISGREKGVVKVIVPATAVLPVLSVDIPDTSSSLLPTSKPRLRAAKIGSKEVSLYRVQVLPAADVIASPDAIERHREGVMTNWNLDAEHLPNAWKEARYETAVTEAQMIKELLGGEGNSLFTMNVKSNIAVRRALGCNDPHLKDLPKKPPMRFFSKLDSFGSSSMILTHHGINAFAMHAKDLAAYSVDYLHKGAPRVWTIVKPTDHIKLEEAIHYLTVDKPSLTPDCKLPLLPPQCAQFLRHQALYLPKETLTSCRVEHTEVVQYQDEMIITFPYAYRQGYNTGPNISEEIAFMTKRSEVFLENGLYRQCSAGGGCSHMSTRPTGLDFLTAPDRQQLQNFSIRPRYKSESIPHREISESKENHPGRRIEHHGIQCKSYGTFRSKRKAFEQSTSSSSAVEGRRRREQHQFTDRSFDPTSYGLSQPRHNISEQSRGLSSNGRSAAAYNVDPKDPFIGSFGQTGKPALDELLSNALHVPKHPSFQAKDHDISRPTNKSNVSIQQPGGRLRPRDLIVRPNSQNVLGSKRKAHVLIDVSTSGEDPAVGCSSIDGLRCNVEAHHQKKRMRPSSTFARRIDDNSAGVPATISEFRGHSNAPLLSQDATKVAPTRSQ